MLRMARKSIDRDRGTDLWDSARTPPTSGMLLQMSDMLQEQAKKLERIARQEHSQSSYTVAATSPKPTELDGKLISNECATQFTHVYVSLLWSQG